MGMDLKKIDDFRWEIPVTYKKGMNVPARIFADWRMIDTIDSAAFEQLSNAAFLPGVVSYTMAMPDIHSGYGLPIGGVMATDARSGVVSPGAAGYDINCGVRLMTTPLTHDEVAPRVVYMADEMMRKIPSGVGVGGGLRLSRADYAQIAEKGAAWAVAKGFGVERDIVSCEANGRLEGGDPETVSREAMKRGNDQMGTLGSGNHFCEIQYVDKIYDPVLAERFGVHLGQVTVMIHTGSRGLGHQIATDFLRVMESAMRRYGIAVPDRQLACAPIESPEGQRYLAAMRVAANYAWANRQILMHYMRSVLSDIFGLPGGAHMPLVYDVAHNIIKLEEHIVDGRKRKVMVHRKGATRAFPPGHPELPDIYRTSGQPVLVPGDMGRMSYLLAGAEGAMEESFGSTCHGAGRQMSRHAALKRTKADRIQRELSARGIEVRAHGRRTLAEEMPMAYKDVSEVVDVVTRAGLARPVARLRPMAVVKG